MTQPGVEEVPPTQEEENRIPHSRVAVMVSTAKEEAAREAREEMEAQIVQEREARLKLEGEVKALLQQKQAEKVWTRAELQNLVDQGRITETQMQSELDRQQEKKLEKLVEERVSRIATQQQNTLAQQATLTQYLQAHPDLAEKGSETQVKLQSRYRQLVQSGMPDNTATEIVALELVLGKPDKPKPITREARQVDEEISGGGEDAGGSEVSKAQQEAKDRFNPAQYAQYSKWIQDGRYKGWSDPQLVKESKQAERIRKAKGK